MNKVIVYMHDTDTIGLFFPINDDICNAAENFIPYGKQYKIVEINQDNFPLDGTFNKYGVPNIDKTFRDAWRIDKSELSDGIGTNITIF